MVFRRAACEGNGRWARKDGRGESVVVVFCLVHLENRCRNSGTTAGLPFLWTQFEGAGC